MNDALLDPALDSVPFRGRPGGLAEPGTHDSSSNRAAGRKNETYSLAVPFPQACLAGTKRRNHRDVWSSRITRGNFREGLGRPFGVWKNFRRSHCYPLTSEGVDREDR